MTRDLHCEACGGTWAEPMRSGRRPSRCPECDPKAAERRAKERLRLKARKVTVVQVPVTHTVALERALRVLDEFEGPPGRDDLAGAVAHVAQARGEAELRSSLEVVAAIAIDWSGRLT